MSDTKMRGLGALGLLLLLASRVAAQNAGDSCNLDELLSDIEKTVFAAQPEPLVECMAPDDAADFCGGDFQRGVRYLDAHRNRLPARVLSRLDMDGDRVPDGVADTDGDGLPDNWEIGGDEPVLDPTDTAACEEVDRLVRFPAPSPMVPGTPPTPIFTRLAVATHALDYDTDHDGLSDFVEVFGLAFIDENRDGQLGSDEWDDRNGDGMPSPGESPVDQSAENPEDVQPLTDGEGNVLTDSNGNAIFPLLHDFDGFVFTDPTNPDTDGDGLPDGDDLDPLINPRAFGIDEDIILTAGSDGDADQDNDGLGNGMDMGNDLVAGDAGVVRTTRQHIDNPVDLTRLIELFRPDILNEPMPESLIEDLLGLDWNGDGLWRTTDIRDWAMVIPSPGSANDENQPPDEFFLVEGAGTDGGDHFLYAARSFTELNDTFFEFNGADQYGGEGLGLGWQRLLEPPGATDFIPDPRVYGVLYAWRVPGFDIDGDGFVGAPSLSAMVEVDCGEDEPGPLILNAGGVLTCGTNGRPFDDYIAVKEAVEPTRLDGVIDPFRGCGRGASTVAMLGITLAVMGWVRLGSRPRRGLRS